MSLFRNIYIYIYIYLYIYSKTLTETIICYRKDISTGSRSRRYILESGIYIACLLNIWSRLCLYNDVMLVMVWICLKKTRCHYLQWKQITEIVIFDVCFNCMESFNCLGYLWVYYPDIFNFFLCNIIFILSLFLIIFILIQ